MKKYIFIDTWNGEGYTDSKAFVEELKTDVDATLRTIELVKEQINEDDYMQLLNTDYNADWCKSMGITKESAELVGYQYTYEDLSDEDSTFEDCEDSGSVICVEWKDDVVGVIVMPNVNDYEIVRTQERWDEVISLIKDMSEEYKDEGLIYGTCHSGMENDYDWILFEEKDLYEEVLLPHQKDTFSQEDLDNEYDCVGSNGIDFEEWEHKVTKEIIRIELVLVRSFNGKALN